MVGGTELILVPLAAAIVAPSLLGPALGAGSILAAIGLGGLSMRNACSPGQCRALITQGCCRLVPVRGQLMCPSFCLYSPQCYYRKAMLLSRASYACSSIIMKHLKRNLNDSQFYKLSEILVDILKVANPANEIRGLNRKLKFRKKEKCETYL